MEEKKVNDEQINATVKSLKWICNQIPNDLGDSNEEKMLKCIKLYCEQAIECIRCLHSEIFAWKQKTRELDELWEITSSENAKLKERNIALLKERDNMEELILVLQKQVLQKVPSGFSDLKNPGKMELEGLMVVCEVKD